MTVQVQPERHIICTTEEVQALCADKDKAHSLEKLAKFRIAGHKLTKYPYAPWWIEEDGKLYEQDRYGDYHNIVEFCPYGRPGDLLWVKETWAHTGEKDRQHVIYKADGLVKWRPAWHMPYWASRLTLHIIDIKISKQLDRTWSWTITVKCKRGKLR